MKSTSKSPGGNLHPAINFIFNTFSCSTLRLTLRDPVRERNNFSQSFADQNPADFRRVFSGAFLRYSAPDSAQLCANFLKRLFLSKFLKKSRNHF